jgi:hypothetical protein
MWINLKCKYITRDGKSVKVSRGEAIPEAEAWPNRDRLARNRFILWIPDAEYYKTQPEAPKVEPEPTPESPKKEEKVEEKVEELEAPPKRKRGRPRKNPEPQEE